LEASKPHELALLYEPPQNTDVRVDSWRRGIIYGTNLPFATLENNLAELHAYLVEVGALKE
jgi:hypothetical protein